MSFIAREHVRDTREEEERWIMMDFVFYGNVTHNDVLVSRLFLVIAPRARGTKIDSNSNAEWIVRFRKMVSMFLCDTIWHRPIARWPNAPFFTRVIFESCKNPRELFWASLKGGEEVCFLPLMCFRLSQFARFARASLFVLRTHAYLLSHTNTQRNIYTVQIYI